MSISLEESIKDTLKDLPTEEEFVIGEIAANEEIRAILNSLTKGYSFLGVKEKIEKGNYETNN